MARVNITVPDDLFAQAKSAGLNVSRVSAQALADELDRRAKIVAVEQYLRDLDAELGPVASDDQAAARAWADKQFGPSPTSASVSPAPATAAKRTRV